MVSTRKNVVGLLEVVDCIGEAGGSPASVSMMGEYYTPENRSRGMNLFMASAPSPRYAMIIGVTVIGWGAIHFFLAAKHFRNELVS